MRVFSSIVGRDGVDKRALMKRMLVSPWMNNVDAERLHDVRVAELTADEPDTFRQRI